MAAEFHFGVSLGQGLRGQVGGYVVCKSVGNFLWGLSIIISYARKKFARYLYLITCPGTRSCVNILDFH